MPSTRDVLVATALVLTTATACSGSGSGGGSGEKLPAGADLMKQSSTAMAEVKSIGFAIRTDGTSSLPVKSADGKLLKSGDATGTLQVVQSGATVEMAFTVLGDSVYLKGVTGGYQKMPKALAIALYDPSAILDPQRGIAPLLAKASGPKSEAEENVGGQQAYRVKATLPKDSAAALVPGVTQDLTGQVWLGVSDHRLLKVKADLPPTADGGKGTVTVTFTDFNSAFSITAPK
jgi:lipoprotein LprG